MANTVKVGMADLNICVPPDIITTLGLGSCVGICIRDPQNGIGGMAHIMLPDSKAIRNNVNIAKFADTGIEDLVKRIVAKGGNRSRLVSKLAGGAQMFNMQSNTDMARIGERNVEASRRKLKEMRIPIQAEDCGLNYGRTIIFNPASGELKIRAVGKPEKFI